MAQVVYIASLSADGSIEADAGDPTWVMPDAELHRHFNVLEDTIGTHLYGRRFYEMMTAYWPRVDAATAPAYEVEYARIWRCVPKVVFSRTLERVEWNARLVRGDAVEEVARLKARRGKDLSIGGSALAGSLAAHGLIDEFRLYVMPLVLGGGKPMFRLAQRIALTLVETRSFASGAVLLRYRRT